MKMWNVHLISLSAEAIEFFEGEVTDYTAPGIDEVNALLKVVSSFIGKRKCVFTGVAPFFDLLIDPEPGKHLLHLIARVEFKENLTWWDSPEIRSQVLDGTYEGVLAAKVKVLKDLLSDMEAEQVE